MPILPVSTMNYHETHRISRLPLAFLILLLKGSQGLWWNGWKWTTGLEYQLVPWEDLEEEVKEMTGNKESCTTKRSLCWDNGSIRQKNRSPIPSACQLCYCDDACLRYGDCCLDFAKAAWGSGKEEGSEKYACISTKIGVPKEEYSYLLDLPVTSAATNITYANFHCALCNDDSLNLQVWNLSVHCSTQQITKLMNLSEYIEKAEYQPGKKLWQRMIYRNANDEANRVLEHKVNCYFLVEEFEDVHLFANLYGGRVCYLPLSGCEESQIGSRWCQEMVRQCNPAWTVKSDFDKCQRYSMALMHTSKTGRVTNYKNPHCARCNFVNVTSNNVQCLNEYCVMRTMAPYFPPAFSVLMDFTFRTSEGCSKADEVWDPVHSDCSKKYCGALYKLEYGKCKRDPMVINWLKNSSVLDHSCPRVLLQETEYLPRSDGSILVNATKKVYKPGEFEMHNDSIITICNDYSLYYEGFNDVHRFVTVIILAISLVFLLLHIIIYVALKRLKNLPGKCLFSLSISLFFSQLLFLTTTKLTINYYLCLTSAALIHYFWLASFFWMNVMSLDVCRTFRSHLVHGESRNATFVTYSLFAWLVPLLVVAIAVTFDLVNILPQYKPEYVGEFCWFNNLEGLSLFFVLPVGAIIFENIILFCITASVIHKQAKEARFANISSQSLKRKGMKKTSSRKLEKKERVRFILYLKLFVIQGLTWTFGLVAIFAGRQEFWFLFTIFNGLQGALIFLSFDCKSTVWSALCEVCSTKRKPRDKNRASKETTCTTSALSFGSRKQSSKSSSSETSAASDGNQAIKDKKMRKRVKGKGSQSPIMENNVKEKELFGIKSFQKHTLDPLSEDALDQSSGEDDRTIYSKRRKETFNCSSTGRGSRKRHKFRKSISAEDLRGETWGGNRKWDASEIQRVMELLETLSKEREGTETCHIPNDGPSRSLKQNKTNKSLDRNLSYNSSEEYMPAPPKTMKHSTSLGKMPVCVSPLSSRKKGASQFVANDFLREKFPFNGVQATASLRNNKIGVLSPSQMRLARLESTLQKQQRLTPPTFSQVSQAALAVAVMKRASQAKSASLSPKQRKKYGKEIINESLV